METSTPRIPTSRFADHGKNRASLAVVYSIVSAEAAPYAELSLDVQERACCRWARHNTWDVVECIRDSACGFSTDRPGLQRLGQLLNELRVDVVVAHSPDRFSRCQDQFHQLLADLEQAGASLEFVDDGTPRA